MLDSPPSSPATSRHQPSARLWDGLAIAALLFGVAILLAQYISRDGLRGDEAALALNLFERTYAELLQPLDYNQGAPSGFLAIQKLVTQILGKGEYALRLVPTIASISSLFMLFSLGKRWLSPPAVPLCLMLFGMLRRIVFHAVEAKQYSSDIAIALAILLVSIRANGPHSNRTSGLVYAAIGAISIWFSHPAIFVLAGAELAHWLGLPAVNLWRRIKTKIPIYLTWLASFGAFYWVTVRSLNDNSTLMESWSRGFPDFPLDIIWMLDALGRMFYEPLSFEGPFDALAIACFLVGCTVLYRKNRLAFYLCLCPMGMTLLGSILQKYPFQGRLVIFLAPTVLLAISQGAVSTILAIYTRARQRSWVSKIAAAIVGGGMAIALLYLPLVESARLPFQPNREEGLPQVLDYVQSQQQPGDSIYVFQKGKYQFLYYSMLDRYDWESFTIGIEELDDGHGMSPQEAERYRADLDRLGDRDRLWLIFTQTSFSDEIAMMRDHLGQRAREVDSIEVLNSYAFLYEQPLVGMLPIQSGIGES